MATWDIGRFAQMLYDFDVLPFSGYVKSFFGQSMSNVFLSSVGELEKMGQILVVGGDRPENMVVASLLEQRGYGVKPVAIASVTRESVEAADMAILCFELPEADKRTFLDLAQQVASWRSPSWTLFDFRRPSPALAQLWGAVDDVVMGGVSRSRLQFAGDVANFTGIVSTDNNGGFASVRTKNFGSSWDVSQYEGFRLRVKGDGQRYKFLARCEESWDGVGYSFSFDTVAGEWLTVDIPFASLIPVFRAKSVPERGLFKQERLRSLQLMLSKFEYDGQLNPSFQAGSFNLAIAAIAVYGGQAFPRLLVLSDHTTLQEPLQETQLPYCLLHCTNGFSPDLMPQVMELIGDRQQTNQIIAL
ncbi:CIA30 family protein [[Limnothrix rosea] IAM M-220]|uniref:CIA30 family protein n=1 Tax=[Limnothrix rosea] IAM M-220 TaxID=454133 RepID=UPI00095E7893|nr:CIA30 family protein [[Limnothrix rosea] IAM M-220]OKH17482.1 CIA30 family protein [[Limnothrix rosea] IAM M-220]